MKVTSNLLPFFPIRSNNLIKEHKLTSFNHFAYTSFNHFAYTRDSFSLLMFESTERTVDFTLYVFPDIRNTVLLVKP